MNIKLILKILGQSKKGKKYIGLYVLLSIITSCIGILIPMLTAMQLIKFTDSIWMQLILVTVLIALIKILSEILNYFISICSEKLSQIVTYEIQMAMAREILKMKLSSIDKESSGVFIQRLDGDVNDISKAFNSCIDKLSRIIIQLGIFISIYFINFYLGLYFSIFVVIFFLYGKIRFSYLKREEGVYRDNRDRVSGFASELIRGIRDIKMLSAEESFMNKVNASFLELSNSKYHLNKADSVFWVVWEVVLGIYEVLLVCLLIFLIIHNKLSITMGVVIFNYKNTINGIVFCFSSLLDDFRSFKLSSERISSILASDKFEKETFGNKHLDKVKGDFSFQDVSFSYVKGKKILNNLSFDIAANETVAFVGKTGSGNSTIFNLLCKFYDVDSGMIMIDGEDISSLDKDTIRGNITVISQNPYIFNMSIRDNLRLVKSDLSDKDMVDTCRIACLDEYINTLPDGYDTIVGEGGITLSGGQRQRLAIARALVQKTKIILFDEATSALDNETQLKIQKSIDNMKGEYTILMIAHRLSTIKNANKIFYLEDGCIKNVGTHQELMECSSGYRRLYNSDVRDKKTN